MVKNSNMTNEQKEERLQEIRITSIETTTVTPYTTICTNLTDDLYEELLKNNKRYFFVPLDDVFCSCVFSPRQALDILKMLNDENFSYKVKLTEGYFHRYGFVNKGESYVLSPEELEELKSWLTEILTIGGYLNLEESKQQKEKELEKIAITSIISTPKDGVTGYISINPTKDVYNKLIKNTDNFFFVPLGGCLDGTNKCLFSPKQALSILEMINNKVGEGVVLTLTEGCFYHSCFLGMYGFFEGEYVYYFNSKELEELRLWLTEILTIGGYLNTNNKEEKKTTSSKSVIKYRIKDNTIYATDGKNTGKATCNTKLDTFDEKKGKLIATMRALGFDKKTEERVIDALFGETVNVKELTKAIEVYNRYI